nr:11055_t:CDS:1 [Entrophospora candida]
MEGEKLIWRPSNITNVWLSWYLQEQKQFPPQIAIAIKKTSNDSKKFLSKYIYCSGCKFKKERTSFNLYISKSNLINQQNDITIIVKYSSNHRICHHISGTTYGQCRGIIREELANVEGQPQDIRKKVLKDLDVEIRFTGNRENIPSS